MRLIGKLSSLGGNNDAPMNCGGTTLSPFSREMVDQVLKNEKKDDASKILCEEDEAIAIPPQLNRLS